MLIVSTLERDLLFAGQKLPFGTIKALFKGTCSLESAWHGRADRVAVAQVHPQGISTIRERGKTALENITFTDGLHQSAQGLHLIGGCQR